MALFGVLVDPNEKVKNFVKEVKDKLKDNNLVRNPFIANIKSFVITDSKNEVKDLYVVSITPVYFNYSVFGWIYAAVMFVFVGFNFLVIPGIVVGLGTVFWCKEFYYLMFKYALKKKGYKDPVKMLKASDILEELHFRSF